MANPTILILPGGRVIPFQAPPSQDPTMPDTFMALEAAAVTGKSDLDTLAAGDIPDLSGLGNGPVSGSCVYRTNRLGSRPAFNFNGSSHQLICAAAHPIAGSYTILVVCKPLTTAGDRCLVGGKSATNFDYALMWTGNALRSRIALASNLICEDTVSTSDFTVIQLVVHTYASAVGGNSQSVSHFYINGVRAGMSAWGGTYADAPQVTVGNQNGQNWWFSGDILGVYCIDGIIMGQRTNVWGEYLNFRFPGLTAFTGYTAEVAFMGDSILQGQNAVTESFAQGVAIALEADNVYVLNLGVGFAGSQDARDEGPTIDAARSTNLSGPSILFGSNGTNDYGLRSMTGQASYDNQVLFGQERAAAGWDFVVYSTALPIEVAGKETQRLAGNALARANWTTDVPGVGVVNDVGNDATIGQTGDNNNTTNYDPDKLHPVDPGHAIMKTTALATLAGVLP